jgi:hypothetical protein
MMTLGDAWGREEPPAETSPFAMDYYRNKAREFQAVLNALDLGYQAANSALATGALDEESQAAIIESLDAFEGRRTILKMTAEAINAGATVVNDLGGRFPQLSIPQTLGALPVAPVALVAAIATAAALISWGNNWLAGLNERLKRAQLVAGASPEQRDRLIDSMAQADNAVSQAQASVLSTLAPIVKWGAIALAAFLAYKAFAKSR